MNISWRLLKDVFVDRLIFFLFSSALLKVMCLKWKHMIKYYHSNTVSDLASLPLQIIAPSPATQCHPPTHCPSFVQSLAQHSWVLQKPFEASGFPTVYGSKCFRRLLWSPLNGFIGQVEAQWQHSRQRQWRMCPHKVHTVVPEASVLQPLLRTSIIVTWLGICLYY